MSIATLKRKSNTLHGSFHTGTQGFSLHGSIRNPTYVGRTALSQHQPRTLMKGDTARGSGGCCGTYNNTPIIRPPTTETTEDPDVRKPASKTTAGMIATSYRWIRRPYPYTVTFEKTWILTKRQQCAHPNPNKCDEAVQTPDICRAIALGSRT